MSLEILKFGMIRSQTHCFSAAQQLLRLLRLLRSMSAPSALRRRARRCAAAMYTPHHHRPFRSPSRTSARHWTTISPHAWCGGAFLFFNNQMLSVTTRPRRRSAEKRTTTGAALARHCLRRTRRACTNERAADRRPTCLRPSRKLLSSTTPQFGQKFGPCPPCPPALRRFRTHPIGKNV